MDTTKPETTQQHDFVMPNPTIDFNLHEQPPRIASTTGEQSLHWVVMNIRTRESKTRGRNTEGSVRLSINLIPTLRNTRVFINVGEENHHFPFSHRYGPTLFKPIRLIGYGPKAQQAWILWTPLLRHVLLFFLVHLKLIHMTKIRNHFLRIHTTQCFCKIINKLSV